MENQDRSAAVSPGGGWLVSPLFDLLFIANIAWLALLLPGLSTDSGTAIDFWQVYFITLPHRWITLILVSLDPDRRGHNTSKMLGIAIVIAILVLLIYFATGNLLCLALVDFVWNAWHFAAQHSGILRMYGLKSHAAASRFERFGLRFFVTYSILRTASWAIGWTAENQTYSQILQLFDFAVLALPCLLLFQVLTSTGRSWARILYLISVLSIYSGMLICSSLELKRWLVPFLVASSLVHASEYLAIVSIYAYKRETIGTPAPIQILSRQWLGFLGLYLSSLGTLGVSMEIVGLSPLWQAINLWAALVHYAFDGMIWKLRSTSTAQALGAGP